MRHLRQAVSRLGVDSLGDDSSQDFQASVSV